MLYLAVVNHTLVVTFCKKGFTKPLILILPNTCKPTRTMKMYMSRLVTEWGQGCMHLQSILNLLQCFVFSNLSCWPKKMRNFFSSIVLKPNSQISKSWIYYQRFLNSLFLDEMNIESQLISKSPFVHPNFSYLNQNLPSFSNVKICVRSKW